MGQCPPTIEAASTNTNIVSLILRERCPDTPCPHHPSISTYAAGHRLVMFDMSSYCLDLLALEAWDRLVAGLLPKKPLANTYNRFAHRQNCTFSACICIFELRLPAGLHSDHTSNLDPFDCAEPKPELTPSHSIMSQFTLTTSVTSTGSMASTGTFEQCCQSPSLPPSLGEVC